MYVQTESHDDLLTTNGFRVEFDGVPIAAIVSVGGLNRKTGLLEWTDGGTGITEPFSDQQKKRGPITLKYYVDPTKGEMDRLRAYVTAAQLFGVRINFVIVKYNYGIEVFRIPVYKALFNEETFPELDKNSSSAFEVNLTVPCADWEVIK